MRTRRLLLVALPLTLAVGCAKDNAVNTDHGTVEPLPGNPKGTLYDAAMATPPPDAGRPRDAGLPRDAPDEAPRDAAPPDAAAPRDAAAKPRDAAVRPLPGNPKGSRYDSGARDL